MPMVLAPWAWRIMLPEPEEIVVLVPEVIVVVVPALMVVVWVPEDLPMVMLLVLAVPMLMVPAV